jgi:benzoyl-CoA-dihydrodiol lyase
VVDKRHVRKDRADVFATKAEGFRGSTAVDWGLVDAAVPRQGWAEEIGRRARAAAASSTRRGGSGITMAALAREATDETVHYPHLTARLDRAVRRVELTVLGPEEPPPADVAAVLAQGADYWPFAVTRALDDLVLRLRTNENELGTWVIRTGGDVDTVLAYDAQLADLADHWFVHETVQYLRRTLKRLDVTSRSLVAVIEPGSCFAGLLAELALASDRQYMLDGVYEDVDPDADPAVLVLTASNDGRLPMGNGLSRLQSRFWGHDDDFEAARKHFGERLDAPAADALGLVTTALDDLDLEDEIRIVLEERASLSPDALTGLEANLRFVGPETLETKIFGRLTAWQNWVFTRPNASGPEGALRRYGSGRRGSYDHHRA